MKALPATANGPMAAARPVGLGNQITALAGPDEAVHGKRNHHPSGAEVDQDQRKGCPTGAFELQPSLQ
jgi:hypothetical protein